MNAVEIEDLWVYYRDIAALRAVTMSVRPGTFLGLIGPNGGGKTTLIKAMLGLVKPDRGQIRVFGVPLDRLGPKRHLIGYVPQRNVVDWDFPVSVQEVVLMGRYGQLGLVRRPGEADHRMAQASLAAVGMADLAQRPLGQLSGGQQQRVFLARALVTEPELLILDEPAVGVDAPTRQEFYGLLKTLKERGVTIVVATHDVGFVHAYVEELACLNHYLTYHGTVETALTSDALKELYGEDIELLDHGTVPHRRLHDHD